MRNITETEQRIITYIKTAHIKLHNLKIISRKLKINYCYTSKIIKEMIHKRWIRKVTTTWKWYYFKIIRK